MNATEIIRFITNNKYIGMHHIRLSTLDCRPEEVRETTILHD